MKYRYTLLRIVRWWRSLWAKAGPVIYVTGADPTGEKDSTANIEAAIADAASRGGGVVVLPKGIYKLTRKIP